MTLSNDYRPSFPEYALNLAKVAETRSEDMFRKVGAVALDKDNKVIGVAYNGLPTGFVTPEGFWEDRDKRQKFMIHAEQNLVTLFKKGEAITVAVTTMPCDSCLMLLIASGVKKIYYGEDYPASNSKEISELFGIELIKH